MSKELRTETLKVRFWLKVRKTDGCWHWVGSKFWSGYGEFWNGKRKIRAHRFSYETEIGVIPSGLCVLHRCDNPSCVRPDHLFVGTRADNIKDMIDKRRDRMRGEQHGSAKLTGKEILLIRKDQRTYREIGKNFGVSKVHVSLIKSGKRWGHVHPK